MFSDKCLDQIRLSVYQINKYEGRYYKTYRCEEALDALVFVDHLTLKVFVDAVVPTGARRFHSVCHMR